VKHPRRLLAPAAALLLGLAAFGAAAGSPKGEDLLATEIARWSAYVRDNRSTDPMWAQVKEAVQPVLEGASQALRDGRRLLAMQRFSLAIANLGAEVYLEARPPATLKDPAAFQAEWERMGKVLAADLAPPAPSVLSGVTPAALRAFGETALLQIRGFYETGLEYGQNTMAWYGLYYVGAAQAQRDFAAQTRALSEPTGKTPPVLRPLSAELDGLEDEMLAAYRPPASIDKHAAFIGASSALKEARELDAAGLRYGALYKYLQAALRLDVLRAPAKAPDAAALASRLAGLEARLASGSVDNSIGALYLQVAQADVAGTKPPEAPVSAEAVATDVLPRYFAALEPARPAPPRPAPEVTVTLVRWPYT